MTDDLIRRLGALQYHIDVARECGSQDAATVREARDALTAAQASIAELEAGRDPYSKYMNLTAISRGILCKPVRCAECNCENGGDDCNWIAAAKTFEEVASSLPMGDLRIEVERVHGGWVGYVMLFPGDSAIVSVDRDGLYERTAPEPTREQAINQLQSALVRLAAQVGESQ